MSTPILYSLTFKTPFSVSLPKQEKGKEKDFLCREWKQERELNVCYSSIDGGTQQERYSKKRIKVYLSYITAKKEIML